MRALLSILVIVQLTSASKIDIGGTSWIKDVLLTHFSFTRHPDVNVTAKTAAQLFIQNEFKAYGLEVLTNSFPTTRSDVTGYNYIGVKRGLRYGTADDRPVMLLAHYDTVSTTEGVDDNGSGITALLQAAKALTSTGCTFNYTLMFAAVDFEEGIDLDNDTNQQFSCSGLCGSKFLVDDWLPKWFQNVSALDQNNNPTFQGAIVLETILHINMTNDSQIVPGAYRPYFPDVYTRIEARGRRGDFIAAMGREGQPEMALLDAFTASWKAQSASPEFDVERFNMPYIQNLTYDLAWNTYRDLVRSDHLRFWLGGLPAIWITDTANFRGSMRTCYHSPCDNRHLATEQSLDFLGKSTQSLVDALAALAEFNVCTMSTTTSPVSGSNCVHVDSMFLTAAIYAIWQSL
ncbi:uncharacterized protein LOC106161641 [Lingula anatina]|uniref:Uncharacterized protein LOC106161641 n=1 Tax=Lingula anatina TaxID=7574 RepID=A0A2R2MPL7_LINAN|nr:uncharacterized protein LOC106161641 [Lingula anatina]|eukprot:XP_023932179.1 uncharacterized protein LOC106161641 [Lingula anatina]